MLDTIFIARHGFRMNWHGNITLGMLGRPRDPVLTAHGLDQAHELAAYFASLPADARPQLILSSPYYRTVQTALPTAKALALPIHLEPGLAEWFPPVEPSPTDVEGTAGLHPYPPTRALLEPYFPPNLLAPTDAWPPVLYAHSAGEDVVALHERARRVLHRIERQCELRFPDVSRVLLVSHAATIIAMGRALVRRGPGPPWEEGTCESGAAEGREHGAGSGADGSSYSPRGGGYPVGAGTASLSQYDRRSIASSSASSSSSTQDRIGHLRPESAFAHTLNGSCAHLSNGVEREWNFSHLPYNVTERGMGLDWDDDQAPSAEELQRQRDFWDEQERIMEQERQRGAAAGDPSSESGSRRTAPSPSSKGSTSLSSTSASTLASHQSPAPSLPSTSSTLADRTRL